MKNIKSDFMMIGSRPKTDQRTKTIKVIFEKRLKTKKR